MNTTPLGNRLHIGIFGKRNAGKSSLINAITNQELAVVSPVPGTTTDPVSKTMELLPIGPVVLIDTAGIDDTGELGELRVLKTTEILRKTDYAVLVINAETGIGPEEESLVTQIKERKIPLIGVINKIDCCPVEPVELEQWQKKLGIKLMAVSALNGQGIDLLKREIAKSAPDLDGDLRLVGDLIKPGDFVVLVTPIDKAAPKGRLILPQQQVIRDVIESDAMAVVTKEYELQETLASLTKKPALVVTDSQAVLKVSADTPLEIPLTTFSILFSRYKGDLVQAVRALSAIDRLQSGDRVLVVEGCTHHRQADDIGKVKLPRWLRQRSGADLEFEWASGSFFPEDLRRFQFAIHCGGCMLNRREMCYRVAATTKEEIPMTNYGIMISYIQGVLERAIAPFPLAKMVYDEEVAGDS